jgi:hypothetical protein
MGHLLYFFKDGRILSETLPFTLVIASLGLFEVKQPSWIIFDHDINVLHWNSAANEVVAKTAQPFRGRYVFPHS